MRFVVHAHLVGPNNFHWISYLFIGTLKRGDQLLEANGQNLVGVSNERY